MINCRIFISVWDKDWTSFQPDTDALYEQLCIYAGHEVDHGVIPEFPHMSANTVATLQCIPVITPHHPYYNSVLWFIVHCQKADYIDQRFYDNLVLDNIAAAFKLIYHPEQINCSHLIKQQIRDCLADIFDESRPRDTYGIFIDACDFVTSETITWITPFVDDAKATICYYEAVADDE